MNEREPRIDVITAPHDFSTIPQHELRRVAEDLVMARNMEELKSLKEYTTTRLKDMETSTAPNMPSFEWEYWNYVALINDINKVLYPDYSR